MADPFVAQVPFVSPWWIAWLGVGAAAAAVPVIIHLIHTTRAPQVPFPTVRFLQSAAEKTARRRKIENLLLLLLRMLLLAALALALARPLVSEAFALFEEGGQGAAVIVLDNSASMGVHAEDTTRLARAKAQVRRIIESRWRPERAAVLLTNPGPAPRPERLLADRAELFRTVDRATLGSGVADLPTTVNRAYELLDETPAATQRLWVVTDTQGLSWDGIEDIGAPRRHPEVPVAVIRAGEKRFRNVGITGAEVTTPAAAVGMRIGVRVTVRNGGPVAERRTVLLYADDLGRPRQSETVELAPAGRAADTASVTLQTVLGRAGGHRMMVALEESDDLAIDNNRRLAVEVIDRIPVLCLKARAADDPYEDPNHFLVAALDPGGGDAAFPWAIDPTQVVDDAFDPADLARYDAVYLNAPDDLSPELADALVAWVKGGGSLVLFAGPGLDADRVNRLLGPVLPATLGERVGDPEGQDPETIESVRRNHPLIEELVEEEGVVRNVLVHAHLRAEAAESQDVLVRLSGGDPLIVARRFGPGRVVLVTTTADRSWSNFPVTNLYGPLMVEIANRAARPRTVRRNLVAGTPFTVDLWPEVQTPATVEITGPLGPRGEQVTEAVLVKPSGTSNVLRFDKTWHLGYYRYAVEGQPEVTGTWCTNPDGDESRLDPIGREALAERIGAKEVHVAGSLEALVERFEATSRTELWQYILIACLVLAVAEPLVANWIRPGRGVDRAHPTVRQGR